MAHSYCYVEGRSQCTIWFSTVPAQLQMTLICICSENLGLSTLETGASMNDNALSDHLGLA